MDRFSSHAIQPTTDVVPIDTFLLNHRVRSQWIAFFTLWLFWIIYAIFDAFIYHPDEDYTRIAPIVPEGTQPPPPRHETFIERTLHWHIIRHHRTTKLLRDQVIALLAALAINTFGRGGTVSVEVLTWLYIAFAISWAITYHAGITHRIVTGSALLVQSALLFVIFIIAFAVGWPIV